MTTASGTVLNDAHWIVEAQKLAKRAPPTCTYAVGCYIVSSCGEVLATGFTGEVPYPDDGLVPSLPHAEEIALQKLGAADLSAATLYSCMEPCSERKSGRLDCASRIIRSGIRRVVFEFHEPWNPRLGILCKGAELMRNAGIEVIQLRR